MVKIALRDYNCRMSARKVNNYTTQDAGDLRGMRNMSCWLWTDDKDKWSSATLFKECNGKIMPVFILTLLLFFKLHTVCMLLLSVVCFFNLITHSFHILQWSSGTDNLQWLMDCCIERKNTFAVSARRPARTLTLSKLPMLPMLPKRPRIRLAPWWQKWLHSMKPWKRYRAHF